MYFDEELEYLRSNGESVERTILNQVQVSDIQASFENVPIDFINYLLEIGSGDLVKSIFKVYSNLCDFHDLGLEDVYEMPEGIKLFGDDYSGDFVGFDLSQDKDEVVEFWHESNDIHRTGQTFREYIRDRLEM